MISPILNLLQTKKRDASYVFFFPAETFLVTPEVYEGHCQRTLDDKHSSDHQLH